jgi:hypothetical protein
VGQLAQRGKQRILRQRPAASMTVLLMSSACDSVRSFFSQNGATSEQTTPKKSNTSAEYVIG